MEANGTYKSLENIRPNIRPFVLSRATFAGAGAYAAHWNGRHYSHAVCTVVSAVSVHYMYS